MTRRTSAPRARRATSADRHLALVTESSTVVLPTGRWLGASHVLGRPVMVDEPYPHVCHIPFVGTMSGRLIRLQGRECGGEH